MATRNVRKFIISAFVGVIVTCISLNTFTKLQKEIKAKDQLIEVMQLRDKQLEATKFSYVTAVRDLSAGETIKQEDIQISLFAMEELDGLSSEEMVIGNVLLEPVQKGQILTGYAFTGIKPKTVADTSLRDGYRALTLATSSLDGMSKEMKVGSYVDIFSKSKTESFVLSKIRILSMEPAIQTPPKQKTDTDNADKKTQQTNQNQNEDISITEAKTVTFEVPVNKIQDLVDIYSSSKILLVMRPIGDNSVIVGNKQATSSAPKETNYNNYNYNTASLPELPNVQVDDTAINDLPAPIQPPTKVVKKTVEIIEAGNRTQVSFD